jgi:hypothetical protein
MEFDGDDASTGGDQRGREGSGAGADVDHEVAGLDPSLGDDQVGPAAIEPVIPPWRPGAPGHGASW